MTAAPPASRRRVNAVGWLCGFCIVVEIGLVSLLTLPWTLGRGRHFDGPEAAAVGMYAVSAAVSVVVLVLAIVATLRTVRRRNGHPVASFGWTISMVRLLALPPIVMVVAAVAGPAGMIGLPEVFLIVLALVDAGWILIATGAARRMSQR